MTGASSGIGREVAIELGRRGWNVCLVARRREAMERVQELIGRAVESHSIVADLADAREVHRAATEIQRLAPDVSALVNNAGFGLYRPFLDHDMDDHRRLLEVNYLAHVSLVRALLPGMLARGGATIVNVSSTSAKMAPWGHSGYAASKAALKSFSEALHAEYREHGIRSCCVFPGVVDTPYFDTEEMRPLRARIARRLISPRRCAVVICDCVERPHVWRSVPWHYRALDWILAVSPTLAHRLVRRSSVPAPSPRASEPEGTPGLTP